MRRLVVFIAAVTIFAPLALGGEPDKPKILVYSAEMPGFAGAIADALQQTLGEEYNFTVVTDPSLLSALLPMPDTACVILAVMGGREVRDLVDPLVAYFENGGAAVGFQGCCSLGQAGEIARYVFPVYGNATGAGALKEGRPVNEYVRDQVLPGFSDIPDRFDLIGQFFVYSSDLSRHPIEPSPVNGETYPLFRDPKTNAPLVLAYENQAGSRSVALTGCFVRPMESARNYYGKLVGDPLFVSLLTDSVKWTLEGKTRYSAFQGKWQELIREEKERIDALRRRAEERSSRSRKNRLVLLTVSWVLGLAACGLILRKGFGSRGPG